MIGSYKPGQGQGSGHKPPIGLLEALSLYARLRHGLALSDIAREDPCTTAKIALSYLEELGYHKSALRLFNGHVQHTKCLEA